MYTRQTTVEVIDKSRTWNAHNCHGYMIVNHGNVNVTLNNAFVLRPGQWFASPPENPDVFDTSDLDIQFDERNDPTYLAPTTGTHPDRVGGAPNVGDPTPERDKRVVIFKSYLSKIQS
jgi:hypothetical protein